MSRHEGNVHTKYRGVVSRRLARQVRWTSRIILIDRARKIGATWIRTAVTGRGGVFGHWFRVSRCISSDHLSVPEYREGVVRMKRGGARGGRGRMRGKGTTSALRTQTDCISRCSLHLRFL